MSRFGPHIIPYPHRRRAPFGVALMLALAMLPGAAPDAKKLYKYRDASGRWAYSDSPPDDADIEVEVRQLAVSKRQNKINLVKRGGDSAPRFVIVNQYYGPIEMELRLADGSNVATDPELPRRFLVPAVSERLALRLRQRDPALAWGYDVRVRSMLGDSAARHRPSRPYRAPFASGAEFVISQGFGGDFSHNTADSRYAVDIAMPEGTPVHAARGGVVMDVANDFFSAGADAARYASRANMIRILHDDGTMAIYGHLQLESARVVIGARVERGQPIAQSGNTGYSTGPHLHFAVQRNADLKLVSVPFAFADHRGEPVRPRVGHKLSAY